MKPIFTIHAGEYLVGTYIEQNIPNCEVWIPSKDTGVDFLLTNKNDRSKNVSIQVKFSKDFLPEMNAVYHDELKACGWWTLNPEKILKSTADLWIFAPYSFANKNVEFVIIEPQELFKRFQNIHGISKSITTYLWVTKSHQCYETRGLKKKDLDSLVGNGPEGYDSNRDFSSFLNAWEKVNSKLK